MAIRPKSPNSTRLPRVASPLRRPRCCLRYLVRAGIKAMSGLLHARGGLGRGRSARGRAGGRGFALGAALGAAIAARTARSARSAARRAADRGLEVDHLAALDVALVDPDLHAQRAVGGEGRGGAVLDVGLQRGERHAPFALLRLTRHLGAAQTAVELDLHALCSGLNGRLDRALDRAPEGHALLERLGDHLGHQLRLQLGALDLVQGQVAGDALGDLLQLLLELLDAHALAAHEHARTRGVDHHVDRLGGALDLDAQDARRTELLEDVVADLLVLQEELLEVLLAGVPARAPGLDDRDAEARRMDLLSHVFVGRPLGLALLHRLLGSRLGELADLDRQVRQALLEGHRAALRTRSPAQPVVEQRAVVGAALADHQAVDVDRLVLAGVRDRALQHLDVEARAALRGEAQHLERLVDAAAADQVGDAPGLARGDAREAVLGDEFGVLAHGVAPPAAGVSSFLFVWPRKMRVGANSPSLCPTMSSVT